MKTLDAIKAFVARVCFGIIALWLKFVEGADLAAQVKRLHGELSNARDEHQRLMTQLHLTWTQKERMAGYLRSIGHGVPE